MTLRAAMSFIHTHPAELPRLDELAGKSGTLGKRLSAIFRERLAHSHLGMQDIAGQIGFRSACNFTTAFRERMGMTPTAYRSSVQGGDHDAGS